MVRESQGGVAELLRLAAEEVAALGDVHVQDLVFHAEPDGIDIYLTLNVYFFDLRQAGEIVGQLHQLDRG